MTPRLDDHGGAKRTAHHNSNGGWGLGTGGPPTRRCRNSLRTGWAPGASGTRIGVPAFALASADGVVLVDTRAELRRASGVRGSASKKPGRGTSSAPDPSHSVFCLLYFCLLSSVFCLLSSTEYWLLSSLLDNRGLHLERHLAVGQRVGRLTENRGHPIVQDRGDALRDGGLAGRQVRSCRIAQQLVLE